MKVKNDWGYWGMNAFLLFLLVVLLVFKILMDKGAE